MKPTPSPRVRFLAVFALLLLAGTGAYLFMRGSNSKSSTVGTQATPSATTQTTTTAKQNANAEKRKKSKREAPLEGVTALDAALVAHPLVVVSVYAHNVATDEQAMKEAAAGAATRYGRTDRRARRCAQQRLPIAVRIAGAERPYRDRALPRRRGTEGLQVAGRRHPRQARRADRAPDAEEGTRRQLRRDRPTAGPARRSFRRRARFREAASSARAGATATRAPRAFSARLG